MHKSNPRTCEVCHHPDCDGRVLSFGVGVRIATDALREDYGLPMTLKGKAYVMHTAESMALIAHSARAGKGFSKADCMCTHLTSAVTKCVADDILNG